VSVTVPAISQRLRRVSLCRAASRAEGLAMESVCVGRLRIR
jgi:hypothetical protein